MNSGKYISKNVNIKKSGKWFSSVDSIENRAARILVFFMVYSCALISTLFLLENVRNIHSYWFVLPFTAYFQFAAWSGFTTGMISYNIPSVGWRGTAFLGTILFLTGVSFFIYQDSDGPDTFSDIYRIFYSIEFATLLGIFYAIKKNEDKKRAINAEEDRRAYKVFKSMVADLQNGITVKECYNYLVLNKVWLLGENDKIYLSQEEVNKVVAKLQEYYKEMSEEERRKDNRAYHEYKGIKEYDPYLTEKSIIGKFIR